MYALDHAYDGTYYDENQEWEYATPLWYAVVAEAYPDEGLIDKVITLYTCTEEDWDFLNSQGEKLIKLLAENFPAQTTGKVIEMITSLVAQKSHLPYLFLFEALNYADVKKYKSWFLEMLEKRIYWEE